MTLKTLSLVLVILVLAALPASATVSIFLSSQGSQNPPVRPGSRVAWVLAADRSVQDTDTEAVDVAITMTVPSVIANFTASGDGWSCSTSPGATVCSTSMTAATAFSKPLRVEFDAPATADGGRFVVPATLATSLPNTHPSISALLVANVYRTFAVTTADDFGAGSFRDAIAHANERCDGTVACLIPFSGPMTIEPQSPLPAVTACLLTIDGGIARATSPDVDRPVEISGGKAGFANGLELRSWCGVTLRGITINGFAANGLVLAQPQAPVPFGQEPLRVEDCFIGTDTTASIARPNGMRGIALETPFTNAAIQYCTISGNRYSGIAVWQGMNVEISSCLIGAGRNFRPLGNGASGVFADGGNVSVDAFVAYNHDFGVAIGPNALHVNVAAGGLFANAVDLDWGLNGPTRTDPASRMPPVPQLIDATYDPATNRTIVRGVLPAEGRHIGFHQYSIRIFERSEGRYLERFPQVNFSATVTGDIPFTMNLSGDLRNRTLVGQTIYTQEIQETETDSSEISESIVAH
jgi:hypothetical protein